VNPHREGRRPGEPDALLPGRAGPGHLVGDAVDDHDNAVCRRPFAVAIGDGEMDRRRRQAARRRGGRIEQLRRTLDRQNGNDESERDQERSPQRRQWGDCRTPGSGSSSMDDGHALTPPLRTECRVLGQQCLADQGLAMVRVSHPPTHAKPDHPVLEAPRDPGHGRIGPARSAGWSRRRRRLDPKWSYRGVPPMAIMTPCRSSPPITPLDPRWLR
jgi:hypothetical protein